MRLVNRLLVSLCILGVGISANAQNAIVWNLGKKDGSCAEFALAAKDYSDYLKEYPSAAALWTVGTSTGSVPFVMPGSADSWAGCRNSCLMIRFNVDSASKTPEKYRLILDFVEVHPAAPPRMDVTINGESRGQIQLPAGRDQDFLDKKILTGNAGSAELEIPGTAISKGLNVIKITNVSGSWAVLDDVRLEAASKVRLTACGKTALSLLGAESVPALIYSGDGKELRSPVKLTVANWESKSAKAEVLCDGKTIGKFTFGPGISVSEVSLPEKYQGSKVSIALDGKDRNAIGVNIKPAEKWTIYLVQHTHTDIGYTKPQTEILTEHLRYIDYAVKYCEATEEYPDDSKFRWTCEASWAVKEWLSSRPKEQVEKFLHYVKNGQIEVTAMFFNMSELSGENNYKTFLSPLKEFQKLGIPVETAMQNDVNGVAWCLADYLPDLGVKYITMGSNNHRADIPFHRPTLYKWQSPAGKTMVSFRADHYNTGNGWGIDRGDYAGVENGVFSYISSLKHRDYNIPMIAVQYSGYLTDNSPPSMQECEIIRKWNDHYAWPKLRSATAHEFLERADREYGDTFPVYCAAYPDWWTDGFGSAARESAASRTTQSDLRTAGGMLAMAALNGDDYPFSVSEEIDRINENLLFYNEHTFGAAESISNPLCENSQVQWAEKGSYVWDALKNTQILYEKAAGRLQGMLWNSVRPTLTFFNSMLRPRSALVKVYIDYELIPKDRQFSIVDENGNELDCQPLSSRREGRYYAIMAENIPAMGYRTYEIVLGEGQIEPDKREAVSQEGVLQLSNEYYTLTFDKRKGGISSVFDKENNLELIDKDSQWLAGEFVYESLEGDRHQMERKVFERYSREGMTDVRYTGMNAGRVYQSVWYEGKLRGCANRAKVEVRLFNDVKRIEVSCSVTRLPEEDPSGIYVAFPFRADGGSLVFDVPGGTVEAGKNQLPRSSAAWNTVQSFAAARNSEIQTVISTDEIPLFMMGEMLNDPYRVEHVHSSQQMYSWIMNNYWTTNFRASQEGELKWEYAITSSSDTTNSFAAEFGSENRCPVYARVCPPSIKNAASDAPRERSFLEVGAKNLLVTSCEPSRLGRHSVILNVREVDGADGELVIAGRDGRPLPFIVVNALEEELTTEPQTQYQMKPFENVFVMVNVD